VDRLVVRYPPGTCEKHPDIACFYYAPRKYHFELNDTRLRIWATLIVSSLFFVLILSLI
jgi:hypothetical protein